MTSSERYQKYKKDQGQILRWLINESNSIIRLGKKTKEDGPIEINDTRECSVADILSMSKMVAKHVKQIPFAIAYLFRAVIEERSNFYAAYQQRVELEANPKMEKENTSHKYFLDILKESLEILGGSLLDTTGMSYIREDRPNEPNFHNYFSILSVESTESHGSYKVDDVRSEDDTHVTGARPQKNARERKNRKRVKKSKQTSAKKTAAEPSIGISVENYRIKDDDFDYYLVVSKVWNECVELRSYTQSLWKQVIYEGVNGAVAASLTNLAVAMTKTLLQFSVRRISRL